MRLIPALLTCLLLLAGCPGPAVDCRVGADCASGVCRSDGLCAPVETPADGGADAGLDAGNPDGGSGDAGTQADAGTDAGTPVGCLPNHDGTITRAEVITRAGLRATFRASTAAPFSTAGTAQSDGGVAWDFTAALAGDTSVLVETTPLAGQWFESSFPNGQYVTPLGQGSALLAVFESTPDALLLHGVASPTNSAFATRLVYSPPAKVLIFPLQMGATWSTTSSVSGLLNGGAWVQTEAYASTVDRQGEATTPYAGFPSLRVRTVLTRTVGVIPTVTRSFLFVTECFGTVATVTSQANETATEFTQAVEVRRLSP